MAHLPLDCPHTHCRTRKAGFTTLDGYAATKGLGYMFAACGVCNGAVILVLKDPYGYIGGSDFTQIATEDIQAWLVGTFPSTPKPTAIEAAPENVASSFRQAEAAFDGEHWDNAALMYRKAVERSLRHVDPSGSGTLAQRIRDLEARHALPPTLIAMMDRIRFLGNDAAHEDEDITAPEAADAREFVTLLLTYLFELPARIERAEIAREKRLGKS